MLINSQEWGNLSPRPLEAANQANVFSLIRDPDTIRKLIKCITDKLQESVVSLNWEKHALVKCKCFYM